MDSIVEFIGYATGELVLYALTFGRRKPNWDYPAMGTTRELLIQWSTWLGWIFWGAVFLLTAWLMAS